MDDLYDLPPGIDDAAARSQPPPPGVVTAAQPAEQPRCWPSVDAMQTDGDRSPYICLAWANGTCKRGARCSTRHALPTQADEDRLFHAKDSDVFGRTRVSTGTPLSVFDPLNCTILHIVSGVPHLRDQHARRRCLDEAFGEWGQVLKTWFLSEPGSAFVKFKWRSTAQLVLEACHGRPLRPEDSEPLQLAWCTTDPSIVVAQQGRELAYNAMREARERGRATQELYERLEREAGGRAAAATGDGGRRDGRAALGKRARNATAPASEMSEWFDGGAEPISAVAASYPGGLSVSEEELSTTTDGALPATHAGGEQEAGAPASAAEDLPAGWSASLDPHYRVMYYWNASTGATQWERPS